jgi:small conductance mechanosensitive channel
MLYLLQVAPGGRKVVPDIEQIRKTLQVKEDKLTELLHKTQILLEQYTPRVIAALLVLLIGLWLIKRIAALSEKAMVKRELEISLRTFLRSLLSIGLKIVLVITVAGMIGIGTASFVTILGAAGLAIGLALQGSLSNFAGGVLILIFKPFKVGDSIEAGGQIGEVIEIQIFNTILLTGDHKTVILPNGPISNSTIINNTRHGDIRLDIPIILSNTNNVEQVKAVIQDIVNSNPKVLTLPKPIILLGAVANGAITFNVRPFCLPADAGDLTSELNHSFKVAFEQHNFRPAIQESIVHTISAQ